MRPKIFAALCIFSSLLTTFFFVVARAAESAPFLSYEVLRELPHEPSHFTQGLIVKSGRFLESIGLYGHSAVLEKDIDSGRTLRRYQLPSTVFGEGLTQLGDHLYLLSWRERTGYVLDTRLRLKKKFRYEGEGWGLTTDNRALIVSDGTPELRFMDPETHAVIRRLTVRDGSRPIDRLNELEYAQGWILANIWYSDLIALIDPQDGRVVAWIDLSELRRRMPPSADAEKVLNGIAFDATTGHLYVTGKFWPRLFELKLAWPPANEPGTPLPPPH
jgi:glutamine cyclotransferase